MAPIQMICTTCGHMGSPKTQVKGSFFIELTLWLLLLVPGVIYSVWRLTSKQLACPMCRNPSMIPIETPIGRQILAQQRSTSAANRTTRVWDDPVDKWEREQKLKGLS